MSVCEHVPVLRMPPPPGSTQPHLGYLDCVRGYAILMVIGCHLALAFPNLPYPVHRVVVMGWFGVQLFFLASCLTLLRSWHAEQRRNGRVSRRAFFLRRLFRIAPAYYLAAALYVWVSPPAAGYDAWRIFASLIFINALSPAWAIASQSIVPGGWSIGVEFAFYALFPILAARLRTVRSALLMFAAAIAFGLAANHAALSALRGGSLPPQALAEGLFFWFPNELSVFTLGGLAYALIERRSGRPPVFLDRNAGLIAAAALLGLAFLAYIPAGTYLGDWPPVPSTIIASLLFVVFIVALSAGPGLLVNRPVAAMGRVSFSAYLLHFAIIDLIAAFPAISGIDATGYGAIAAFTASWPVVVGLTFATASLAFRLIEAPMIRLGKAVSHQPGARKAGMLAASSRTGV